MGIRLLDHGTEVNVWRGRDTQHFESIIHSLADVAGKTLQLEIFDHKTDSWGYVVLAHVLLVSPLEATR